MSLVRRRGNAHATPRAVPKVLPAAHAAEAALVAVKRTFLERHPYVAFRAVVLGEGDLAFDAFVGLAILPSPALLTYDLLDREPVHRTARRMVCALRHDIVVTYPAPEYPPAARR
eukprot:CAMPEP_0181132892 /NCGR_PEP_ID=MMETSP1071-20121207/31243_1 /TAXON_ID=35127 /ORGANISM="Thalassiosira sp., Strain NH16" /LENGTH=114 /DNA_ID=CAMNT_0023219267 /DNA_START=1230 /DNA_END=1571 /DNA_ORIENTATION=+